MSAATPWIAATRSSHDRFAELTRGLSAEQAAAPSYDTDWTVGQVASHLGSQAEIFGLFLDAGVAGAATPESEVFQEVWGRWDALTPIEQVRHSLAANEGFVSRLERWTEEEQDAFRVRLFGRDSTGLPALLGMRLSEHALHSWDVAVTLDPAATLLPDAVELLIDNVGQSAGRAGRPDDDPAVVSVTTTQPERHLELRTSPDVSFADDTSPAEHRADPAAAPLLGLPAEALLRLVAGRLDPDHTPPVDDPAGVLTRLRTVFPGY